MVSVLLNRTKIHVFDWIFKFYSNKVAGESHGVAVKAHGVCGESNRRLRLKLLRNGESTLSVRLKKLCFG